MYIWAFFRVLSNFQIKFVFPLCWSKEITHFFIVYFKIADKTRQTLIKQITISISVYKESGGKQRNFQAFTNIMIIMIINYRFWWKAELKVPDFSPKFSLIIATRIHTWIQSLLKKETSIVRYRKAKTLNANVHSILTNHTKHYKLVQLFTKLITKINTFYGLLAQSKVFGWKTSHGTHRNIQYSIQH